jgi:hypothetical protein
MSFFTDRVVVFAVVALEMPASTLTRELELDRREREAGLN